MLIVRKDRSGFPNTMPSLRPRLCEAREKAHLFSAIDWLNACTRRRVDFRVVPFVSLLYSFAMIDRVNLGAAYTAGMGPSLVRNLHEHKG